MCVCGGGSGRGVVRNEEMCSSVSSLFRVWGEFI